MGGHSAWRKRVSLGLLAKEGGGGAIARHRPRFGRMGLFKDTKDWKNNKKKKNKKIELKAHETMDGNEIYSKKESINQVIPLILFVAIIVTAVIALYVSQLKW